MDRRYHRGSVRGMACSVSVFASGLIAIILMQGKGAPIERCGKFADDQGDTTMATSTPGNVTPRVPAVTSAAPIIRTIGLSDLGDALRLGWEDFKAVPSHAIILCVIYPVLGLVLARLALGYSVLPL